MLNRPFSIYTLLTFAPLLLLLFTAACGPAAPREAGREAETFHELQSPVAKAAIREAVRAGAAPAEREAAAEIAALAKEVAAVKAQLAQLTEPGVTIWSAVITPAANAGNVVWTRVSGETVRGTISGETGAAAARLLKIQLTTASKDLTVTTPGPAAAFTDQTLRIGDNYLSFRDQADSATYSSNADQTVWSFVGDYTPWYQTGNSYQVSVLSPINAANLLPDPMPAATAIPGHLLGYADDINQVPLSLLDDRYRRQVPDDTPKVLTFPANPATGDSVILLHPDAIRRFFTGTVTQGENLRAMAVNLTIPGGNVTSLQGYIPTLTGSDSATLRGKVFVITSGSPTSLPQSLSYKGTDYTISQTAATNLPGFYEVTGLMYAGLVVGEKPQYAFTLADGNIHPSSRQYQPDPYTFNGSSWELTPGSVSRWAEAGKPDEIPSNKLTAAAVQVLHSGPGTGISISNSGQTTVQRFAFTAFTPAFDLTAAGKGLGTITVRAKLRLTSGSPSAIGFDDNTPTLRGTSIAGIAFASAVKAGDDYSSAADNGIQVGDAVIHNGATTLGTVSLYLARDADNNLGYYLSYTGKSGSLMFNLDLSGLEVGFIPNDKPRSIQGGKLATWTAQTTTPTGGGRKPNWSVESILPGTGLIGAQPGNLPIDQHNRIRVDSYTPTAQCFGWLFIAKVSGTEVARAVVTLSPTGIIPKIVNSSSNLHPAPAFTRMYLGNSQFLVITYHSILNGASGQDRINISPQPTGFDADGNETAWTTWPANLTVELYEAVIN